MTRRSQEMELLYPLVVGLAGWVLPGAGHFMLRQWSRGIIICLAIVLLFVAGLYIGSIGVIDPVNSMPWYVGQMLTSPIVAFLARMNPSVGGAGGVTAYPSYGKPFEVGQIYTTIAGMLNVLCVINAMYVAYSGKQQPESAV
jgi:hypothetical protein